MRKNFQNVLQWLLPFTACAMGFVSLLVNFRGTLQKIYEGDVLLVTLVLVTFLCGAYGVERLAHAGQLGALHTALTNVSGARVLYTREEVYAAAERFIQTAEKRIRVVLLGSRPRTPDEVLDAIVGRLKEKKDLRYEGVYVLRCRAGVTEYPNEHIAFFKKLKKANVIDRCTFRTVMNENPVAFDALIIDEKHVGIGFTRTEKEKDLQSAIGFQNQPDVARLFAGWFDYVLRGAAEPADDLYTKLAPGSPPRA